MTKSTTGWGMVESFPTWEHGRQQENTLSPGEGGPKGRVWDGDRTAPGASLIDASPVRLSPAFLIRLQNCPKTGNFESTFSPGEGIGKPGSLPIPSSSDSIITTGMAGGMHRPPLTRGLAFAKQKTGGETRFSPSVFACGESTSLIRGRPAAAAGPGIAKAF